jgi:hypothetical protein
MMLIQDRVNSPLGALGVWVKSYGAYPDRQTKYSPFDGFCMQWAAVIAVLGPMNAAEQLVFEFSKIKPGAQG